MHIPIDHPQYHAVAEAFAAIARKAGREILRIYETGFEVAYKADASPLTSADKASHEIIVRGLAEGFPDIPILSEEGAEVPYATRARWERMFVVDPLDGTKEFVNRNGDFAVNIALVEGTQPTTGCLYLPVHDSLYLGGPGIGAFRDTGDGFVPIRCSPPGPHGPVMVLSRSHPSPELEQYMLDNAITCSQVVGAARKFCMLAEGTAHIYPRYNPTMEWDTAAGHALLLGAGGSFTDLDGQRFGYNKKSLRNGGFIASWEPPRSAGPA